MRLILGHDDQVKEWTAAHIPHVVSFGTATTIGIALDDDDQLIAGMVYHDYQPAFSTIQMSGAATSARWAPRGVLRAIFDYPFNQLGVNKVWTATPSDNLRAIRFNEGVGMRREGILAHHFGKSHAVICRMLRREYNRNQLVNPTAKEAA